MFFYIFITHWYFLNVVYSCYLIIGIDIVDIDFVVGIDFFVGIDFVVGIVVDINFVDIDFDVEYLYFFILMYCYLQNCSLILINECYY